MAARLKTYTAEIDGVHEWIVAAPNQKAALDAFGVRQNLFAQGFARAVDDPALSQAASARPGIPLNRAKGSKGPFTTSAAQDGGWDAALKAAPRRRRPPSRKALDAARAALDRLEAEAADAEQATQERRAALEREAAEARRRFDARREKLQAALDKAEDAYRAAGGRA